jgi:hypothetical protein
MSPSNHVPDRVSSLELFFDLVFVFTITQVAEVVVHHPDASGHRSCGNRVERVALDVRRYAWLTNAAGPDTGHAACCCSRAWRRSSVCALGRAPRV